MSKISTSAKYLDWFRKVVGKIHTTWFWNNAVNAKLVKEVTLSKFFILLTLTKHFGIDNLDDFISNTLF